MRAPLIADRLRHLLDYDPLTGLFTRRVDCGAARAGAVAGTRTSHGYVQIAIDGQVHFAHRLVFLHVYGYLPQGFVDHIDGDRRNNRLLNLREATASLNAHNRAAPNRNNRAGLMGVTPRKNGFIARIMAGGKTVYLGIFPTADEAHAAYLAAKQVAHPGASITGENRT